MLARVSHRIRGWLSVPRVHGKVQQAGFNPSVQQVASVAQCFALGYGILPKFDFWKTDRFFDSRPGLVRSNPVVLIVKLNSLKEEIDD